MRYHLFIIGYPYNNKWWARHISMGVITAGFDNEKGDRGYRYLNDMDPGDWVIAYANGFGAAGAGKVGGKETYRLLPSRKLPAGFESRHRQFRSVKWINCVTDLADAVPFSKLHLGFTPRNTKTEFVDEVNARRIISLLAAKAGSKMNGSLLRITPKAIDLQPPERVATTTYRILRDTAKARTVKMLHQFKCQVCGKTILLPDGSSYAEAHHIQPLGGKHRGPDVVGNILCLCPNHHAEFDFGVKPIKLSGLRSATGHVVDSKYVEYYNRVVWKSKRK
jgi:hypothetical protein